MLLFSRPLQRISTSHQLKDLLYKKAIWNSSETSYMKGLYQKMYESNRESLMERSLAVQLSILEKMDRKVQQELSGPMSELIKQKSQQIIQSPTIFKIYSAQINDLINVDKQTLRILVSNIQPQLQQKVEVGFGMDGFTLNQFFSDLISLRLADEEITRVLLEFYRSQMGKFSIFNLLRFIDISISHGKQLQMNDVVTQAIVQLNTWKDYITLYDIGLACYITRRMNPEKGRLIGEFIEVCLPKLILKVEQNLNVPETLGELLNTRPGGLRDLEVYFKGTAYEEKIQWLSKLSHQYAKRNEQQQQQQLQ